MVAHPLRVRSARCAVESEQNKLRRNFFPLVWFETFLWPCAAPQYSFGANACHDGEAQQRVGGLPHKRRVFVLVGIGASGSAAMQDFVGQNIRRGAIRSPRNKTPRAFARRFGTRHETLQIISSDIIAAELGEWARGFALDQRLSGAKAQRDSAGAQNTSIPKVKSRRCHEERPRKHPRKHPRKRKAR
jgi:hypothetical protein